MSASGSSNSVAPDQPGTSGWHAVTPLEDCPHTAAGVRPDGMTADVQAPCEACGHVGENMQCLTCHVVRCGRHVAGHMLEHSEATGHPLVVGFADLSFWCYGCNAYLDGRQRNLGPVYAAFQAAKFAT